MFSDNQRGGAEGDPKRGSVLRVCFFQSLATATTTRLDCVLLLLLCMVENRGKGNGRVGVALLGHITVGLC